MTRSLLFLCLFTCLTSHLYSQCPPFDAIMESQAEVDAFIADYPNCTTIVGTLRIGTTPFGNNTNITNISGLSNITSINSGLLIYNNPNLASLDGLQNVSSVGGLLSITDNSGLANFEGLNQLESIGSSLLIDNNYGLESLDGLGSFSVVPGKIYLANNVILTDISAFSNISSVGGDLDIRINLKLESLTGLEQLTSIGEEFVLMDNHLLSDIDALNHSISIGESLEIKNNFELDDCNAQAICDYIDAAGSIDISNNGLSCSSIAEIEASCVSNAITDFTNQIKIFPNPAHHKLLIDNQSTFIIKQVSLINCLGKAVINNHYGPASIDVSNVESGIYFLKILFDGKEMIEKVFIKG